MLVPVCRGQMSRGTKIFLLQKSRKSSTARLGMRFERILLLIQHNILLQHFSTAQRSLRCARWNMVLSIVLTFFSLSLQVEEFLSMLEDLDEENVNKMLRAVSQEKVG